MSVREGVHGELSVPRRLLVVLPSWIGDAVMATPTLRVLRERLPGALIGGLMRPGIEEVLAGTSFLDEVHVERAAGMMGPKRAAAKVRPRQYDTALLLTNSFSTALITRLAGIERRIGYERDARGMLLTHKVGAPRREDTEQFRDGSGSKRAWAPVPAREYYFRVAEYLLGACGIDAGEIGAMELAVTEDEARGAEALLARGGLASEDARSRPMVVLNPGGNDAKKRWPVKRFAMLADHLAHAHRMTILLNGSPGEQGLVDEIAEMCASDVRVVRLPNLGIRLGTLKGIVKQCALMVTNDTGPRHIAAALGTPVVTLFGPTDHRWTTIGCAHEVIVLADPTLPENEVANDHPERCRIDRIELGRVIEAVDAVMGKQKASSHQAIEAKS